MQHTSKWVEAYQTCFHPQSRSLDALDNES